MVDIEEGACNLGNSLVILLCGIVCLPEIINLGGVGNGHRHNLDRVDISEYSFGEIYIGNYRGIIKYTCNSFSTG